MEGTDGLHREVDQLFVFPLTLIYCNGVTKWVTQNNTFSIRLSLYGCNDVKINIQDVPESCLRCFQSLVNFTKHFVESENDSKLHQLARAQLWLLDL